MTKVEMFNEIKAVVADNAEMVEFIDHEIEMIQRKNARKSSKPTAKQVANDALIVEIKTVLADSDAGMTATEVAKALDGEYTTQKISALLRKCVESGEVVKAYEKKVARFTLA